MNINNLQKQLKAKKNINTFSLPKVLTNTPSAVDMKAEDQQAEQNISNKNISTYYKYSHTNNKWNTYQNRCSEIKAKTYQISKLSLSNRIINNVSNNSEIEQTFKQDLAFTMSQSFDEEDANFNLFGKTNVCDIDQVFKLLDDY